MRVLLAIALCVASFAVVNGTLAGLRANAVATAASREDRFDIVTINPTTGVAASTQKQVYALYDGAIDMNNFILTSNNWALSFQAYDLSQVTDFNYGLNQNTASMFPLNPMFQGSNPNSPITAQGYFVRQDLRTGGRFEYCELSANSRPIVMYQDGSSDNSVVALVANPVTGGFSLARIAFQASTTQCLTTPLITLPNMASVSANVFTQRGSRIYFVNEPVGGFTSTTAGAQVRCYDIQGSTVTNIAAITLGSTIIPVSISTISPDVVEIQAWNSALSSSSTGFATYEINILTFTSTTTAVTRGITSSNEELSFTGTMLNQTNAFYSIKNVLGSSNTFTPTLAWTSFASVSTSETKAAASMGTTAGVFKFFDLGNLTNADIFVDSALTTSVALRGLNAVASVSTGSGVITGTVSQCRITYVGGSTTPVTTTATGTGEAVSCPLGSIPSGTTSIDVEYAADGVNFGPKNSFAYAPANSAAITGGKFSKPVYNLRDATAFGKGSDVVMFTLTDAAGRKVLFHPTSSYTLSLSAQGNTVVRNSGGLTGSVVNGVVSFPNLFVDLDKAENTGSGIVRATLNFGNNAVSAILNVRMAPRTSGTLAALAFPTSTNAQVFETHLVNPAATTAASNSLKLNTRALADTISGSTLGLGTTTYDRDNKVLNTLEVSSANVVLLNGVYIGGSSTSTSGSGVCKIVSTSSSNDTPYAIFYEGTATDKSANFLGLIHNLDGTTGVGRKVVRFNRLAGSAATTSCTTSAVDSLPIFDTQYGNHHIVLLTGSRLAIVEPDFFFTATNQVQATSQLLSVWQLANSTANTGSWLIRNKVLSGFSIVGVTQSGDDELAINGVATDGTQGIWTVDVSSQIGAVTAPSTTAATRFTSNNVEQALFLSAGSAESASDARLRYTGLATAYTASTQAQSVDTVQLSRGSAVPSAARTADVTGRNYIDFFLLEDPVVTAVTPSRISLNQAATVTVTGNNVISSPLTKCRFSTGTGATASTETTVFTSTTSATFLADGSSVNCGTFPGTMNGINQWVYVQLSNDGGLNYGPEQRIGVGSIQDAANPSNTVFPTGAPQNNIFTVAFLIKVTTSLKNPTTAQDTAIRNAITTVLNRLSSIWTKSAITSSVESDGTTSYSITVSTTTSSSVRAALQATTATSAQLQQEVSNAVNPNGTIDPSLAAAGATGATVTRVASPSGSTSSSSTLSDGAIAGIVIGSVVGGLLIIGLIVYLVLANKKSSSASTYSAATRARTADVGVVSSSGSSSSSSSSSSTSEESYEYYDEESYDDEDYEDYI